MLTTAFTAFSAAYVRSGYCSAWYDVKCVPSAGVRSTSRSMYCTEPSRGAVTFQAVNPPAAADTATTPKIKNAFFIITNWFNKLIRGNFRQNFLFRRTNERKRPVSMRKYTKIGTSAPNVPICRVPERYSPNSLRMQSTASSFSHPKYSISRSTSRPFSQTFSTCV